MRRRLLDTSRIRLSQPLMLLLIGAASFLLLFQYPIAHAQAVFDDVSERGVLVSDPGVSAMNVDYIFSFNLEFTRNVGSIELLFCSNDALIGSSCTTPTGIDFSGASIVSQSGITGMSISPLSTPTSIILTRTAQVEAPGPVEYHFTGVTNPDTLGTSFGRIKVFPTTDASGPVSDGGGIAFSTARGVNLASEVPPFLTFCSAVEIVGTDCSSADGANISLGVLEPGSTAVAETQFVVATNAGSGYSVSMIGTTLTSGNFVIDALETPAVSQTGVNQFGVNLRNNSNPDIGQDKIGPGLAAPTSDYNNPNLFKFISGDVVATNTLPTDTNKFTASYITNVSSDANPGFYAATLSFVATASF